MGFMDVPFRYICNWVCFSWRCTTPWTFNRCYCVLTQRVHLSGLCVIPRVQMPGCQLYSVDDILSILIFNIWESFLCYLLHKHMKLVSFTGCIKYGGKVDFYKGETTRLTKSIEGKNGLSLRECGQRCLRNERCITIIWVKNSIFKSSCLLLANGYTYKYPRAKSTYGQLQCIDDQV